MPLKNKPHLPLQVFSQACRHAGIWTPDVQRAIQDAHGQWMSRLLRTPVLFIRLGMAIQRAMGDQPADRLIESAWKKYWNLPDPKRKCRNPRCGKHLLMRQKRFAVYCSTKCRQYMHQEQRTAGQPERKES